MKKKVHYRGEIEKYLYEETILVKRRINAIDFIINTDASIKNIEGEIVKARKKFAGRGNITKIVDIKKEKESIEELETSLLILIYLYKMYQGYSENIINVMKVRRGNCYARQEALEYSKQNSNNLDCITKMIKEKEYYIKELFPPGAESSPVKYLQQYIITLEEIKKIILLNRKK